MTPREAMSAVQVDGGRRNVPCPAHEDLRPSSSVSRGDDGRVLMRCQVEEAALELNLSKATIRAWIAQGRLGHVRLGRAMRIPTTEIQRVLESGYVPPERGR